MAESCSRTLSSPGPGECSSLRLLQSKAAAAMAGKVRSTSKKLEAQSAGICWHAVLEHAALLASRKPAHPVRHVCVYTCSRPSEGTPISQHNVKAGEGIRLA